ncbi:hypothetical protein FB45DRAFT_478434 [Roridomyces roridus]|uniref:NmrA-like domain-containing protein n=1 Tax=Roridomyces roridus TaxID=1738132 RepID=A0AAD7BZL0_9AGAR|nr:hypothetical protein FB45DRAFT_478434 [Roridomyces roridus]
MSTTQTYTSFAVIGAGTIGLPILAALATTPNVSVILITRPSKDTKSIPVPVPVVQVDYNSPQALASIFLAHKVQVVLSTIGPAGSGAQECFVEAVKLARESVKLFVPSEYGFPTDGEKPGEGMLGEKQRIADVLQEVGIPSARFFTGLFIEWVPWLFGYDPKNNDGTDKFTIVGTGETPLSLTAIEDIAGFVAYVLTTLPPSSLQDKVFRIQGDRATPKEIAALFNAPIEYKNGIEGQGEMGEFKNHLFSVVESGAGSTGWDSKNQREREGENQAGSANGFWAGHAWRTVSGVYDISI